MPRVPLIGRLYLPEYLALVGSFILIGLEIVVRVITLALPRPVIRFLYGCSRRVFNYLSSSQGKKSRDRKKGVSGPIADAADFVELCELYGYYAEEHIVQTKDGYLLGLHRLGWRRGEEDQRVNSGEGSLRKRVAYLHHGLMMNSEVWVCLTEKERCLPFVLVEQGYDVWLGNNRGNKYSKKSVHHSPTSPDFWNYSIDQFAFHDIPDSIDYILATTHQPSLSYIGFSQGTAQAFATLSIHPNLNDKVDVFIALAPAMAPPGLASGIVSSFIKASPEVLFLAFGRKAILSSTTMWQALLYPAIFTWVIDLSLKYLFGWHARNITEYQKLAAYPHLFSFSSTKSVVHWLQIIRNGTFQMYDDEVQAPLSISAGAKYYKVAKYPTRNIKTPIVLVYGGSDSLVNIKVMLKELPRHTVAKEIPHYEHLDFLWASDVDKMVFPHVLEALDFYASLPGRKTLDSPYRVFRNQFLLENRPSTYSEDGKGSPVSKRAMLLDTDRTAGNETDSSLSPIALRSTTSPHSRPSSSRVPVRSVPRQSPPVPDSPVASQITEKSTTSRPEGWWSSDEVAGTSESPSPPQAKDATTVTQPSSTALPYNGQDDRSSHVSRRSIDSLRSVDHTSVGLRGISLGQGKAAAAQGVVIRESTAAQTLRAVGDTPPPGPKKLKKKR
ncbi:hypothetical protein AAFC00_000144 [Neodothiora populina]|uniref:Partial AB-hydrolase lipase domain-containing protein n=1 Tax=Neodothiora populina TaxID=2781224 RepID=A0ABR3P1S4_9PEZI